MLTIEQTDKLARIEELLTEIVASAEYQELDYQPDLNLADAQQAVIELLNEHYREKSELSPHQCLEYQQATTLKAQENVTLEQQPEQRQKKEQDSPPALHFKRVPLWRINLADWLTSVAISSLLTAALAGSLSVFFWGVSDLDKASGNHLKPDWAATSLGYRGLAIASLGLFGCCRVSAGIVGGDEW